MHQTIFNQLISLLPDRAFRKIVSHHEGDLRVRRLSCWSQLLCMVFAQLSGRGSLRDIVSCLDSKAPELYHMGIRSKVARSTLADANERRPSVIFKKLAYTLIGQTTKLYANDVFIAELKEAAYLLDSTHIELCKELCPWAHRHRTEGTVKVHTLLQGRGSIPAFIAISDSKYRDNMMLDNIPIEPGAFYIMDKAYFDLYRLCRLNQDKGYFVVRLKRKVRVATVKKLPCNSAKGVIKDSVIRFTGSVGARKYPDSARRVVFKDPESEKKLTFITNNFTCEAHLIAELYRRRWDIEIFFRWLKQNLKIRKFYGNSLNAVETQIWCALIAYLLVAILKKRYRLEQPLSRILQILSISLFEKIPVNSLFLQNNKHVFTNSTTNQLDLFPS